ncbi:hypothetical protein GCM10009716_09890 [Streptomyces sodiiphilus]|uniref:Uncharacterized protein n=1 Tax=Streptomyces sodiiphilus TaxID=226217 RepID=A0ABP5A4Y7_9ACTN
MASGEDLSGTRLNGIDDGNGGNIDASSLKPDLSVDSAELIPIGNE